MLSLTHSVFALGAMWPDATQPAAHDTVELERHEIYARIFGHLSTLVAITGWLPLLWP